LPQPSEPANAVQLEVSAATTPPSALVASSPAPPSRLRRVGMAFLFWLIYLLMFGICLTLLGVFMRFAHRGNIGPLWLGFAAQIGAALSAIVPGFVMARIEQRPFGNFGLPARNAFGRNFWVGTLWGIGSLTILMLMMRLAGAFEFGTIALHGAHIWKFAAYYAIFFLLTGFFEEFLVRGYSQWVLSRGLTFWPAAALLSAAFGALHSANGGESKAGLIAAALIGFFFCLTLRRT
jgi:CAAX protease family protein